MTAQNFDLEFVIDTPPDEYTIKNFHKTMAKICIKKYGIDVMKRVVKEMDKHKQ